MKRLYRLMVWLIPAGLLVTALLLYGCDAWVKGRATVVCYDNTEPLPETEAALVLGCSPRIGSRANLFFIHRIEAAQKLFTSGKVRYLIVSGDNGQAEYDEPTAMKEALVAAGVPEDRIYCDYAGFRTLDSVVRAKAIFGQQKFIVVSQRFHNERAVFLARQHGLEAFALNAQDVSHSAALRTYLREWGARVKAVLDVTILQTQPKFYGPEVQLGIPQPLPVSKIP